MYDFADCAEAKNRVLCRLIGGALDAECDCHAAIWAISSAKLICFRLHVVTSA